LSLLGQGLKEETAQKTVLNPLLGSKLLLQMHNGCVIH